jgi:uncharacterized membrane protein
MLFCDPTSANVAAHGSRIQHQSKLIMSGLVVITDWIWKANKHPEFLTIIEICWMIHFIMVLTWYISDKLRKNHYQGLRITINYLASVVYLVVIIITIGLYK